MAKSTGNGSETIIPLYYALGNTKSPLAIDALLSSLSSDDLDIQISVIRGLDVHLNESVVQQVLTTLLKNQQKMQSWSNYQCSQLCTTCFLQAEERQ